MRAKSPITHRLTPRELPTTHDGVPTPDFDALLVSWRRSLAAANMTLGSQQRYLQEARILCAYVARRGLPLDPRALRREHLTSYFADELQRRAATTVRCGFVILGAFWRWLADEGEIAPEASPFLHLRAPKQPPIVGAPVLTDQDVQALLKVTTNTSDPHDFLARRDHAILRTLLDTGLRRAELAALTRAEIDLDAQTIQVAHGKGDKPRVVFVGVKTVKALDRYIRLRATHKFAGLPRFWLSEKGELTPDGVYRMVKRRAAQAGIGPTWAHLFRHTWAHLWLDAGGTETDLLTQAGWSSLEMLKRYGASDRF